MPPYKLSREECMKKAHLIFSFSLWTLALSVAVGATAPPQSSEKLPAESPSFPKSINAVLSDRASLVLILPTNEADKAVEQRIWKNAREVFKIKDEAVVTDQDALKKNLAGKNIVVYGTPVGNLWLSKHISELPVKIEAEKIVVDKEYPGNNLRFLSVWANPQDPAKGMMIYTAQRAEDIEKINSIFHGPTQFLIARGTQKLKAGFYRKLDKGWGYSDYPHAVYPVLTHEQMLADFDALMKIAREIMPTVVANKKVFGLDVIDNLQAYRAKSKEVPSAEDFAVLLDNAINSCKGSHFRTDYINSRLYKANAFLREYTKGYVDELTVSTHEKYFEYIGIRNQMNLLNIPLFYFNGDYYVRHDFVYQGVTYPAGLKVVKCNGQSPDAVIKKWADSFNMLPWDFRRKKFYHIQFFQIPGLAKSNTLHFVFMDKKGKAVEAGFPADVEVEYKAPQRPNERAVEYCERSKVLYVRCPIMNPQDIPFFKSEIIKQGQNRNIRAAVVDIRGNGGGSDDVWKEILSCLVDGTLIYEEEYGIRNTELAKSYVQRHPSGKEFLEKSRPRKISFLDGEEFLVLKDKGELKPAPNSLKVPVYVLSHSIFSAAGSLTTLAKLVKPIISVGFRNSFILGMGINPFHFSLPNSKFLFTIEPVLDLTGCKTAEDVYHTDVEVEIAPTLDEMLEYYNQEKKDGLEEFLTAYDPFFKAVLRLLEKS